MWSIFERGKAVCDNSRGLLIGDHMAIGMLKEKVAPAYTDALPQIQFVCKAGGT